MKAITKKKSWKDFLKIAKTIQKTLEKRHKGGYNE